jgi:hypothetical protein
MARKGIFCRRLAAAQAIPVNSRFDETNSRLSEIEFPVFVLIFCNNSLDGIGVLGFTAQEFPAFPGCTGISVAADDCVMTR